MQLRVDFYRELVALLAPGKRSLGKKFTSAVPVVTRFWTI